MRLCTRIHLYEQLDHRGARQGGAPQLTREPLGSRNATSAQIAPTTMHRIAKLITKLGLQAQRLEKLVSGGSSLRTPKFDTEPEDYLDKAEFDLLLGSPAGFIDAVANAKRAIACEVDRCLGSFGALDRRAPLPRKIDRVQKMGFVAPRLVRKVATMRNVLEHEYKRPKKTEAEDAVDIASLFVSAVERHLRPFEDEFSIGDRDEYVEVDHWWHFKRELGFGFDKKRWRIYASQAAEDGKSTSVGKASVGPDDVAFDAIIALVTAGDHDGRSGAAIGNFFAAVGL